MSVGTVGIMSMQRILNYGSSLQAHSLKSLVEAGKTVEAVRFIDYEPGASLVAEAGSSRQSKAWRAFSKAAEYGRGRGSAADKMRFINHKRTYAGRYFPLVGVPTLRDCTTDVDVQIIGSDEVFNCVQSNSQVGYAPNLFGKGSHARSLVSYAASFGNTTLASITKAGIRDDLEEAFSRFDHISVRDRNSQSIVEQLTGRAPEIHVDPALAFDLMAQESRIPGARQHKAPYMVVYAYPGRLSHAENIALRRLADSRGWKILTFGGFQECGDRFLDCDPFALLAYFRDAEAVVTDTFHGTIFSLITQRPFLTFVRRSQGEGSYGNEEKLGFLLESFGLGTRRVHDISRLDRELVAPVPWDDVATRLMNERRRSANYLASVVGGVHD